MRKLVITKLSVKVFAAIADVISTLKLIGQAARMYRSHRDVAKVKKALLKV